MKKSVNFLGVLIFTSLLMIACGGGGGGTGGGGDTPIISDISIAGGSDNISLSWTTTTQLDQLAIVYSDTTEFDLTAIENINLTDILNNEEGLNSIIDEVIGDNPGVRIDSHVLDNPNATSATFSRQDLGQPGNYSFAFVAVYQNILRWHSSIYTAELLPVADDDSVMDDMRDEDPEPVEDTPLISNVLIENDLNNISLSWTTNTALDQLAIIYSNAIEFDLIIETINLTDVQNNEMDLQGVIDEIGDDNPGVRIDSHVLDNPNATSATFSVQDLGQIGNYSFAFVAVYQNLLWVSDSFTGMIPFVDEDNDSISDQVDNCPTIANTAQLNRYAGSGDDARLADDADEEGDICDDTDEDGHNDHVDNCPLLYDPLNLADCRDDTDNDGYANAIDVDDDNDSLIEIWTPEDLDEMRHVLDGSGRFVAVGAEDDRQGCPATGCTGYELMRDISLAGLNYGTAGWQPIGHDTDSTNEDVCDGDAFTAIFEGNGLVISGLSINRSQQDCVGLFGHVKDGGEIRNVTVEAGEIYGRDRVGSLVGYGDNTTILSTSVIVDSLSANYSIGGLMGEGLDTPVIRSHAIVDMLRGNEDIGGLVGYGSNSHIFSSYAIVNSLTGGSNLGGLMGTGTSSIIFSSYTVVDLLDGTGNIGGLVGGVGGTTTEAFNIYASYAIANSLNGDSDGSIGGLVGSDSTSDQLNIEASYAVFGSLIGGEGRTGALIGAHLDPPSTPLDPPSGPSVIFSYWNNETSDLETSTLGIPKTTHALVSPTDYTEPYNVWMVEASIVEEIVVVEGLSSLAAIWCDQNHNAMIEDTEQMDSNRIWDFGTDMEYPAINCIPDTPEDQRTWWHLNAMGQPIVNQTKFDGFIQ